MINIQSIPHEFQILPLDFIHSDTKDPKNLKIPKEIRT
jgi:hypothetical protein